MNSQKNFVQAPAGKGIFDKAFAASIALIILVGGIWGTERVLIYLTDKQIAEYEGTTNTSFESVSADDAVSVHDVTSRIATIQKLGVTSLNSQEILAALEKSTIPQVKLTEFNYKKDGTVTMKGTAPDYRFLAEQILRYRQEAMFSTAEVADTERTDTGQVAFTIRVIPGASQSESAAPPEVVPTI